jgi:DNA mismatch endonuclease (patch repair protein)
MPDVVDAQTRSRMMSGIRGKNTKPELVVRRVLHRRGFRYRIHATALPGKPDMAFAGRRAVVFVHGCFWHGHDCHLFKWPSSRVDFWRQKITRNQEKDAETDAALRLAGWRRLIVWECALKGRTRLTLERLGTLAGRWLETGRRHAEIRGR